MNCKKDFLIKKSTKCLKRCPDFDNDCIDVKNKIKCYEGQTELIKGEVVWTDKAIGHCPFLT